MPDLALVAEGLRELQSVLVKAEVDRKAKALVVFRRARERLVRKRFPDLTAAELQERVDRDVARYQERLAERVSIAKAEDELPESWQALHAKADAAVPGWRDDFLAAVKATREGVDVVELQRKLGSVSEAAAVELIDWSSLESDLRGRWQGRISDLVRDGAQVAAGGVSPPREVDFGGGGDAPGGPRLVLRFDLLNPRSLDYIEGHAADLVREVTLETRAAIRQLVDRSFRDGVPPVKLALQIEERIGLTSGQEQAVAEYRAFVEDLAARPDLEGLSAADTERLRRGLLTPTLQVPNLKLIPDRVARMEATYRDRLLAERAENIARTETINAANRGQQLLWEDAIEQGFVDPEVMVRFWIVTPDDRLCPECAQMVDERAYAELDQPFDTPAGPKMAPTLHPRCRCAMSLKRRPDWMTRVVAKSVAVGRATAQEIA